MTQKLEDKNKEVLELSEKAETLNASNTQLENQIRSVNYGCLSKAQQVLNLLEMYHNDDELYKRTVLMIWNTNQQETNGHNQGSQAQKNNNLNSIKEIEASTTSLANRIT